MPLVALLGAAGGAAAGAGGAAGAAGTLGTAASLAGAAGSGGNAMAQGGQYAQQADSVMQQAQAPQGAFDSLANAGQLQGPTRSGVPMATATQANMLGSTRDFNAKDPGLFGNMVKGATGQGGTGFGGMAGALLANSKPGGQGVPQVDASFMNQPMSSPQQDMAIQRSVDPQTMLLAMLRRQVG